VVRVESNWTVKKLDMLQEGIAARQKELQRTADRVATHAKWLWRLSTFAKVSLVVLGALSATKAAADQVVGSSSTGSVITYTALGVLIATVAGLQAALHLDRRVTELTTLAAESHALVRSIDSQWYEKVGLANPNETDRIASALDLLAQQDDKLTSIQQRAAESGVNIAIEVRELTRSDEKEPYSA